MAKMITLSTVLEYMHVIGCLGKHLMDTITNAPFIHKAALLSLQRMR